MSNEANVELVKQGYAAFTTGNIPGLLELLSDDIEWVVPGPPSIAFAGTYHGKNEVLNFFMQVGSTNEIHEFNPHTFIADGDHVAVVGNLKATIKTTGKTSANEWVHVWTIRDGKAVRYHQIYDTAEVVEAFTS